MKSKIEKILLILIILLTILIGSYLIYHQFLKKPIFSEKGDLLNVPDFAFSDLNGKVFSRKDLPKNKPLIVFYFNPDCGHCKNLAQDIRLRINGFKMVNLVWVSPDNSNKVLIFSEEFDLKNEPNVWFLTDTQNEFYDFFGENYMPTTYLFKPDGAFLHKYKGSANASKLFAKFEQFQIRTY